MTFHWWWILIALTAVWVVGWWITVVVAVFFNPLDSEEDKRKDLRERFLAHCVIHFFLWPGSLPELLATRKLYRDMRTGKRPAWIVLAKGEESARQWTLADGTQVEAGVSGGSSSELSYISADYDDDALDGPIEYRTRMIAPTPGQQSDWSPLKFTPRPPEPDGTDENAVDDYTGNRFEASVQLSRGNYAVEFRVRSRSGKVEICSALTLIVADAEDYNL